MCETATDANESVPEDDSPDFPNIEIEDGDTTYRVQYGKGEDGNPTRYGHLYRDDEKVAPIRVDMLADLLEHVENVRDLQRLARMAEAATEFHE